MCGGRRLRGHFRDSSALFKTEKGNTPKEAVRLVLGVMAVALSQHSTCGLGLLWRADPVGESGFLSSLKL